MSGKDEKNLLSEYNPKRVLVAMTGGSDSTAAAFLLKKQGYDCTGISFDFIDVLDIKRNIENKAMKSDENINFTAKHGAKVIREDRVQFLKNNCSVNSFDLVKRVCDRLDIPFYAVNARAEYKDYIFDNIVSARLEGCAFQTCIMCNNLKVNILIEKAHKLKAGKVAMGHYAKVHKDEKSSLYQIFASHDSESDQSYLLSRLDQNQLRHLLLPLGDLRKREVLQLIKRFQLTTGEFRDWKKMCFCEEKTLSYFIDISSYKGFKSEGTIVGTKGEIYGEHEGIHNFTPGQKHIEVKEGKMGHAIDSTFEVIDIDPRGKITIGSAEDSKIKLLGIHDINISAPISLVEPLEVYVKNSINGSLVKGTLYFKNLTWGMLEFAEMGLGFAKGQYLAFYDRLEKGGKILLSGRVANLSKDMELVNRLEFAQGEGKQASSNLEDDEELEKEKERKKKLLEFSF